MTVRLNNSDPGFAGAFQAFLGRDRAPSADLDAVVAAIVDAVQHRGDAALLEYARRFDGFEAASPAALRVTAAELDAAEAACDAADLQALDLAARRIRDFHEKTVPADLDYTDAAGVRLGVRWRAVESAGIYVPGGLAAYPSSVLMNAVPARVAGVARLVMVSPAPQGHMPPLVLAAARRAGIDEIWRIGGAQAVAALALGTEMIHPVDMIAGPGNAYVTAAKRMMFGRVGIDMIAGPSEILVLADADNDPRWIAADLLSQAEHDVSAQSVLITDDAAFARAVEDALETLLADLPRRDIAGASWREHGAVIVVSALEEAIPLIDRIAPEHLELAVAAPRRLAEKIRNAGAMFLGRRTPEAIGDYIAGPSHVLPTSRSARFSSGLGVSHFMKRSSVIEAGPDGFAAIGPAALQLARAEGLQAHALSLSVRLQAAGVNGGGEGGADPSAAA